MLKAAAREHDSLRDMLCKMSVGTSVTFASLFVQFLWLCCRFLYSIRSCRLVHLPFYLSQKKLMGRLMRYSLQPTQEPTQMMATFTINHMECFSILLKSWLKMEMSLIYHRESSFTNLIISLMVTILMVIHSVRWPWFKLNVKRQSILASLGHTHLWRRVSVWSVKRSKPF